MYKNKFVLILLAFFFLTSANASQIYHGDKATSDEQFPFVVAVYHSGNKNKESNFPCSGSVIEKNWVLTALHCVAEYDENYYVTNFSKPESVSIGLGHRAGNRQLARKIISVKDIHTLSKIGDPLFLHDFALLKLTTPADVAPVALPSTALFSKLKAEETSMIASGFGILDVKWKDEIPEAIIDEFLHYGKEQIQPKNVIQELNKKYTE